MNRTIVFDSPFLLGFDHTFSLIERAAKAAADSYPPYNVEALADDRLRITLAVAGFSDEGLSVAVEAGQLTITGKREAAADDPGKAFLHREIAARAFTRAFVLADGMEVEGAALEHGLLHVDVVRKTRHPTVKHIPITARG